jgi:hypothetical protein
MVGGYEASKEGMNFGIEECLAGTNNLYPYLSIRTLTTANVLTITQT